MASAKRDYKQSFDVLVYVGYINPFLVAIRSGRDHLMLNTYIVMTKKQCDPFKFLFNTFMTYISLGFKEIQRVKIVIIISKP